MPEYSPFEDPEGKQLLEDQVAEQIANAADKLSRAYDPRSMYAALEGMSADDVRLVVERFREKIGNRNILRIHSCQPLWLQNETLVQSCAERIIDDGEIPDDIRPVVEGWAADKIREKIVENMRRRMAARLK